jgi:hypothetical protein
VPVAVVDHPDVVLAVVLGLAMARLASYAWLGTGPGSPGCAYWALGDDLVQATVHDQSGLILEVDAVFGIVGEVAVGVVGSGWVQDIVKSQLAMPLWQEQASGGCSR